MQPDSSIEPSQSANVQANTPLVSPIDALLAVPADHDISGGELAELLANIVNHIRRKHPALWQKFLHEARLQLIEAENVEASAGARENYSTADELEETYQGLQNQLIQIRATVARAIATEKRLEQQLQKNQDQDETWAKRAKMAVEQKKPELAEQAQQRQQQYTEAAKELASQFEEQKGLTLKLRQRLADVEGSVQKAYTRKQVLISRESAAQAHIRINELLAAFDSSSAMERIAAAEQKVVELELQVATSQVEPLPLEADVDSKALLIQMTAALDRAVKVISLLESRLKSGASVPDSPQHDSESVAGESET